MNKLLKPILVIIITAAYFYITNRFFGYACPSEILIGLPCPGCGLTRAAFLLLKGDFAGSLRMNPALLFIPAYFILVILKKKNAADNYLIAVIILSVIVYIWRIVYRFGVEPMAYNPNNIAAIIFRLFILKH